MAEIQMKNPQPQTVKQQKSVKEKGDQWQTCGRNEETHEETPW